MALDVKIKAEDDTEYTLTATRVDQRIEYTIPFNPRAGKELPRIRPTRSARKAMFIVTGRATQTEKDNLEAASKTWFEKGTGATSGRVRFTWGENNSGNPYNTCIWKLDIWKEAAEEKYEFLLELQEGDFS